MNQPLIIYRTQSRQPLVQARDILLAIVCWGLWGAVFFSIVNGDGFHLSATYLSLVLMLSVGFILWSIVHYLINPMRNKAQVKPLSLKKLARHFHVHSELIGGLQQEKQVLVVLSPNGSVTQLASLQQRWRPVSTLAPKSLTVKNAE